MWRRCAYWCGVLLIAVALAAIPSLAIVESYVGGSAVHGYIEDGRYFVNPEHGRPIIEVSESTWRAVYWLERLWPFSALVPGLTGLFLTGYGRGPNGKPPAVPPAEPPPWVLWACLVSAGFIIAGTWLCWVVTRTPWVVMLVGWILICAGGGTCSWLYARALRRQSTAEPSAAADPARDIGSPDS
jgi:hypothetical protein